MERTLTVTNRGLAMLLTAYQTPAAIRRSGVKRIETWLRNRKVRNAAAIAATAVEAAGGQQASLPGNDALIEARCLAGFAGLAPGPTGLWTRQRQHASSPPLPPRPPAGLLPSPAS